MNAVELRYKLIQFITKVDESQLKQIESILYGSDDYVVPEEHKKLLDERIAQYEANPQDVIQWGELKAELDREYGV